MTTSEHTRGQSEADILADAKAMRKAAEGDAEVAKRLGPAYLKTLHGEIDQGEKLLAGAQLDLLAQTAEGKRVAETAHELLLVMQEIRDAVAAEVPAGSDAANARAAFGVGASWVPTSPDALAVAAKGLAQAIENFPAQVKAAHIDLQHKHDLAHLADALEAGHEKHAKVRADRKDATAARDHLFALLRAAAHHVRLVARVLHRRDPGKLAHFHSPLPAHQVAHRAKPGAPGAPPPG
jgi:hypothetical protein